MHYLAVVMRSSIHFVFFARPNYILFIGLLASSKNEKTFFRKQPSCFASFVSKLLVVVSTLDPTHPIRVLGPGYHESTRRKDGGKTCKLTNKLNLINCIVASPFNHILILGGHFQRVESEWKPD